jgi:hypothetical protein
VGDRSYILSMQVLLLREAGEVERVAKSSEELQRGCKYLQGHSVIEVNFRLGVRSTSKPNIVPLPHFCRYDYLYPTEKFDPRANQNVLREWLHKPPLLT